MFRDAKQARLEKEMALKDPTFVPNKDIAHLSEYNFSMDDPNEEPKELSPFLKQEMEMFSKESFDVEKGKFIIPEKTISEELSFEKIWQSQKNIDISYDDYLDLHHECDKQTYI